MDSFQFCCHRDNQNIEGAQVPCLSSFCSLWTCGLKRVLERDDIVGKKHVIPIKFVVVKQLRIVNIIGEGLFAKLVKFLIEIIRTEMTPGQHVEHLSHTKIRDKENGAAKAFLL